MYHPCREKGYLIHLGEVASCVTPAFSLLLLIFGRAEFTRALHYSSLNEESQWRTFWLMPSACFISIVGAVDLSILTGSLGHWVA